MTLSEREAIVAKEYCKGYTDKEVADQLNKSIWTIKAQKKDIYRKLGISKDTELVLYMLCERAKVEFDIKELRKHGLELFFSVLFIIIQITPTYNIDMRRCRIAKGRTNTVRVTRKSSNTKDYELYS